ncbi:hypothetical protein NDU88_007267 [Pleurodeles waltl]|uniref:Uncharacterized protein n=1 Tax=Pleurodeles waltl TaxID=8319 RepID=A0AAV7UPZ4_PLEWA|nr:hypothetical protein NDU88_007267 [Pleurodeles waltl]
MSQRAPSITPLSARRSGLPPQVSRPPQSNLGPARASLNCPAHPRSVPQQPPPQLRESAGHLQRCQDEDQVRCGPSVQRGPHRQPWGPSAALGLRPLPPLGVPLHTRARISHRARRAARPPLDRRASRVREYSPGLRRSPPVQASLTQAG